MPFSSSQTQHLLQAAYKTKDEIKSQLGGSRLKADLGDRTKWTLNDLEQFKRVLTQYEADLDIFESNKEKDQQTLREIQSNMLKGEYDIVTHLCIRNKPHLF
jgi:hypothetical protein